MEKDFTQPKKKKKQIWEDVAKRIYEIGNYTSITGDMCDNKFRTMMTTYRKIKDKLHTSGSGKEPTWPFFEIFNEHFCAKAAVSPKPEAIGSSLEVSEKSTVCDDNTLNIDEKNNQKYDINYVENKIGRKRKPMETTAGLYKKKIKIDEDRYKEEAQEERWKEKKELEKQKIEAINRLTTAFEKVAEKL